MSFFNNLSTLFGPVDKKTRVQQQRKIKFDQKRKKISVPQKPKVSPVKSQVNLSANLAKAKAMNDAMLMEAKAKAREIVVEAKDQALIIRSKAEKKLREQETNFIKQQAYLDKKLDRLDQRLENLDKKEKEIKQKIAGVDELEKKVVERRHQILEKLEKVSGMSKDEAKTLLFNGLEKKFSSEMARFIKDKKADAKLEAEDKAKEILIDSMKFASTEYVAEYTISVVPIPSEEVKGKIIGKSGRNIHSFERLTGVDVDLDASPTEVRLSSFDPVRREIARVALTRLIKDGRIQPVRIEEQVVKAKKEIENTIFKAGKELCHTVGVYNIPSGLVRLLGKFKYRFSYGQSMITHTTEETKLGVKLAHEMKVDVDIVRLGCLFHDIGKVSDELEGNHVDLGVQIAKKYNLPQPVIDCIAQHHEDESFSGAEQMLVYIADAISGARPGARYENHDEYVKRLQAIEEIANSYPEVKKSYAIQAGRELRVLLEPQQSKDDDVEVLAVKIKDQVREKVIIPGSLTVTVIREVRSKSIAH